MSNPKLLWQPTEDSTANANLTAYMHWLESTHDLKFDNYDGLWQWSVDNLEDFWHSQIEYFNVKYDGVSKPVKKGTEMPGISWFPEMRVNLAEHVFSNSTTSRPALIVVNESGEHKEISWQELEQQVAAMQDFLKKQGCGEGDRIVAYIPNIAEATIAFLAANSLGMVWSSCSPDFGSDAVIDRFVQIEPKVLLVVNGYSYGGKSFDKREEVRQIHEALPMASTVISLRYQKDFPAYEHGVSWDQVIQTPASQLTFQRTSFNAPLWVLYSSGTTGIPKAITHSQGGVLLEMLKFITFHNDVKPGDRSFWFTTTGWMMWNYLHGALLAGATIVLYDGSPGFPTIDRLWQLIETCRITHLGTSAGYIVANMKANVRPSQAYDLSSLRSIGSTGSPLPPEGFDWIYKEVDPNVWLTSISGGTDICSAFVGGCPIVPVYSGEIQCRALGVDLHALDEDGNRVQDEVGEMVIEQPMPSMPVFFWNDPNMERYKSSYFEEYPGKWRHGDWIRITPENGIVIYGRSDATLNRGGVRIGTSEIYRAVDQIEEISDSLIICLEKDQGEFYMPLFVVPKEGVELTDDLKKRINRIIRETYTPRHVPDEILQIPEVPYTISGKKTESPVKKIMMGKDPSKVIKKDALKNPSALNYFIELAKSN